MALKLLRGELVQRRGLEAGQRAWSGCRGLPGWAWGAGRPRAAGLQFPAPALQDTAAHLGEEQNLLVLPKGDQILGKMLKVHFDSNVEA